VQAVFELNFIKRNSFVCSGITAGTLQPPYFDVGSRASVFQTVYWSTLTA